MTYADDLGQSAALRAVAWDVVSKKPAWEPLAGRAVTERGLYVGGALGLPEGRELAALVVLADGPAGPGLLDTLDAWGLQSCPAVGRAVVAADARSAEEARRTLGGTRTTASVRTGPEGLRDAVAGADWAVFARPGDVHHPSLATVLALLSRAGRLDVLVWNDLAYPGARAAGAPSGVRRRPQLERHTLRHVPYVGRAFAVRTELLRAYPHDLLDGLLRHEGHPLHLWLGEREGVAWRTHPETLSAAVAGPDAPSRPSPASLPPAYAEPLGTLQGLQAVPAAGGALPYRLEPTTLPERVSAIIPFRDRPGLTRRCLDSLFRQTLRSKLEVVLVDNGSSPESLRVLRSFVESSSGGVPVRFLSYDRPFNHSRQCNLGIRESSGDVVLLMNNDAVLATPDVLEAMARWALVPGVGTVGCRITTDEGQLVSAGIRARLESRVDVRALPVEESTEPGYAEAVRETLGNSFACAALARKVFDAAGPLDETDFPNGYNDVEYALRLRRADLRHLYLGPLVVKHRPRSSRGPCDESLQAVLLRTRYPELADLGSFQLEFRRMAAAAEAPPEALAPLKRWIKGKPLLFGAAKALLGRASPATAPAPSPTEAPPPDETRRRRLSAEDEFRRSFPFDGFERSSQPEPFIDGLSDDQLKELNEMLPWRSFTSDARGRRFGNPMRPGKRDAPAPVGDRRIERLNALLPLAGKHVLEVGCFEGLHTVGLCRLAGRVTAVDARIENVAKTLVRCGLHDCRPTVFVCDVERRPLDAKRLTADVVHHVGVFYHLEDPIGHLEDLCRLTREGLLLDTHVALESEAVDRYESGGRSYPCRTYLEAGIKDPSAGMSPRSRWVTAETLRAVLAREGLSNVLWQEERRERNGARIAMIVRR